MFLVTVVIYKIINVYNVFLMFRMVISNLTGSICPNVYFVR